jgi:hypothetical protein
LDGTTGFALLRLRGGRYAVWEEWRDSTGHGCRCRSRIWIFDSRNEAIRLGLPLEVQQAIGAH